jgi:peptide/nickel transport system substrate-binding protein
MWPHRHRHVTGWQDETYTGLVARAGRVTDQSERMALYRQADRRLIDEAVVMPLTYWRRHLLLKPWVKRFPTSPLSFWFWQDVIIEPH